MNSRRRQTFCWGECGGLFGSGLELDVVRATELLSTEGGNGKLVTESTTLAPQLAEFSESGLTDKVGVKNGSCSNFSIAHERIVRSTSSSESLKHRACWAAAESNLASQSRKTSTHLFTIVSQTNGSPSSSIIAVSFSPRISKLLILAVHSGQLFKT